MSLEPLVFAFVFIGVLLMVEGLYLLAFGKSVRQAKKVNRRLQLLEQGGDPEEVLTQLRKEREQHEGAASVPLLAPLFDYAAKANIAWSPAMITLIMLAAMGLSYLALSWFSSAAQAVRIPVAVMMGYFIMFVWLRNRAKKRIALFEEQLPDAVELMVRSLRIGHPFSAAISIVAQEMPDPIGTEFGIIADEATYGMDVTESLDRLAQRVELQDLRFLAVAVMIQSQSGGNLAEILEGLSNVIRARFKLFRKIKAITAEARWSGWFLSVFPVLALIVVQLVKPDYYDGVVDHPLFVPATIAVAVMLVLNVIFMRMMVNIKV
ncbi:type II secretion system F family protein [Oceanicella actignis]|uniref:Tight adherence protein B n=1 Tax=Oceanicella actignis TaxID=1189325 RepID=A0A1M7TK06_9RHOB|nr:type II secretion system F family protein [Oceanicella actignis]TYO88211.1 tight adherence protein B [Oceanicella actignis]SET67610.1 tight adherence protein B [Oceanicella actignis]SHN71074.1 tight adherence protein B [Oceanicella actignis]